MRISQVVAVTAMAGLIGLLSACASGPATGSGQPSPSQPGGGPTSATSAPANPQSSSPADQPGTQPADTTTADGLAVGTCLLAGQSIYFNEVTVVACDQAHDAEVTLVFAATDILDGDASDNQCHQAVIDYVGAGYAGVGPAGLDYSWLLPPDAPAPGPVVCTAYSLSGSPDLTGSVKANG